MKSRQNSSLSPCLAFLVSGGPCKWYLVSVLVAAPLLVVGCRRGQGNAQPDSAAATRRKMLAEILPEIPPGEREDQWRELVVHAAQFYKLVQEKSDVSPIAANAAAAQQMVQATQRNIWTEAPLTVGAVLVVNSTGEGRPYVRLVTDTCDLRRCIKKQIIDIQLRPEAGRTLRIELEEASPEPVLSFTTGMGTRVKLAPLEEVLARSSPPDETGVRWIRVKVEAQTTGTLALPDPSQVPMFYSCVNARGRMSNAVRILRVDVPVKKDGWPRRPFGTQLRTAPGNRAEEEPG